MLALSPSHSATSPCFFRLARAVWLRSFLRFALDALRHPPSTPSKDALADVYSSYIDYKTHIIYKSHNNHKTLPADSIVGIVGPTRRAKRINRTSLRHPLRILTPRKPEAFAVEAPLASKTPRSLSVLAFRFRLQTVSAGGATD